MPSKSNEARQYLRKLAHRTGGSTGLESAGPESLSSERAKEARAQASELIKRESGAAPNSEQEAELDKLFLEDGTQAIERLEHDGEDAELEQGHVEALEAIVHSDGSRPTLMVSPNDRIDPKDAALGQWRPSAEEFENAIAKVSSAVGRVDLDGSHRGTAFVVKDNLILTNRHVLQELADEESKGKWRFNGEPSITFDASPEESRSRQFKISKKVVLTGNDFIDRRNVDYRKLDFAVLECEIPSGKKFPDPLPLESDRLKIVVQRPVYTIGYPAKPMRGQYKFEVLHRLFNYRFGVKRFAPGEIDRALGRPTKDEGETVFVHDSTTLAGNSGSCVVDFGDDGLLVVGLHFAGVAGTANHAHANAVLQGMLADLGLSWKDWV